MLVVLSFIFTAVILLGECGNVAWDCQENRLQKSEFSAVHSFQVKVFFSSSELILLRRCAIVHGTELFRYRVLASREFREIVAFIIVHVADSGHHTIF